jgi:hypothetical protein
MAEYQKVEIGADGGEPEPYSEEDLNKIEGIQQREQEAEEEGQEEQVDEERPSWLPEKFGSPEEMAKAYDELQAQFTKDRQEKSGDAEGDTPGSVEPLSASDFSEFNEEFAANGDISDESIAKIEGWGIPREMISAYVEGQKAILDGHFNTIHSEVGGESNYDQMIEWAAGNLPEGEQDAFNRAVMEGSPDEMMFAVRSLSSRWQAAEGTPSSPLVQGSTSASGASGGFRSLAEMTMAMKDPRYSKDPAYRKDIERRLSVSNIL